MPIMRFKKLCSVIAFLLILSIVSACSQANAPGGSDAPSSTTPPSPFSAASPAASSAPAPQESGKPYAGTTIRYWSATANDVRNAWHEEVLARFTEETGIEVEYLGVPGDATAMLQKIDMSVAANDVPDAYGEFLRNTYIERDIIIPLDDYFSQHPEKDYFPQKYMDVYRSIDYKNQNKKLYAMPHGMNIQSLYVRPDFIAAAGASIPTTWDQFFEVAEKTTDKNSGTYGYIIRGGSGSASALEMLMYAYSGINGIFIDGKCTINDPAHVEFVSRYLGGYNIYTSADDMNKAWTEMAAQFQSGKAAMLVHNLGSGAANYAAFNNDESKVRAIPYPVSALTGKVTVPGFNPGGNMIPKLSTHQDEAWELLKFLSSSEIYSSYAQMMGSFPLNEKAMEASWIQETSYFKMGADVMASENTVVVDIPYFLPNYTAIQTTYAEPAIQSVLIGQLTVQELLDEWAAKLQADYDSVM